MKKPLLLLGGILAATTLSAQITINSGDVAGIGSVIPQAIDTLPSGLTPGNSGAAVTWNYSSLNEHQVDTLTFTNPDWTTNGADFPQANLCAEISGAEGVFYAYLVHTSAELSIVGQAGDFLGTGTPTSLPINPGQTIIEFPTTYLDSYTGTYITDLTIDGSDIGADSIRLKSEVDRSYTVDAYGDITTPIGTYPSLRIAITEQRTDSTWVLAFGMWQLVDNGSETSNSYDWWTDDNAVGFPVLSMGVDGSGNATSVSYLKALPTATGLEELNNGEQVQVFPNPASNAVNFITASDAAQSLEVYDLNGRLVKTEAINGLATTIFVNEFDQGVYLYMLKDYNGELIHTGKLSVIR